jgi:hypothetical protein
MLSAKSKPKVEISAVIIRADGTREDLGVIAKSAETIPEKLLNFFKSKKEVDNNG